MSWLLTDDENSVVSQSSTELLLSSRSGVCLLASSMASLPSLVASLVINLLIASLTNSVSSFVDYVVFCLSISLVDFVID